MKGSTVGTGAGVRKLARGSKVTLPATGAIPAVKIGLGPVIPGVNIGTGGNISGRT